MAVTDEDDRARLAETEVDARRWVNEQRQQRARTAARDFLVANDNTHTGPQMLTAMFPTNGWVGPEDVVEAILFAVNEGFVTIDPATKRLNWTGG